MPNKPDEKLEELMSWLMENALVPDLYYAEAKRKIKKYAKGVQEKEIAIKRYIPVTRSFNEAIPPIGRVDVESDDGLMIRMVKDSGFDPEIFTVAPSFIIKKQDKNGNILEAELLSLSIIPKQWQRDGVNTK